MTVTAIHTATATATATPADETPVLALVETPVETDTAAPVTTAVVVNIGRGDNQKHETATTVVMHPANLSRDWTVRGAVAAGILAALGMDSHPLPQKVGPKGQQVETEYGVGFRVLSDAVRALVKETPADKPVTLRAVLSGEGGGSVTIPADHPLYAALVELIGAQA